ncbi:hypothetical protein SynNOUM97013_01029 [Synechococcus sp. NOUM97013]|nr:hypothetical protein SynNOUM97013_01029 [Synechococcus sp. NOUM97013]
MKTAQHSKQQVLNIDSNRKPHSMSGAFLLPTTDRSGLALPMTMTG